ncbi:FliH/SctL family protein [uncultured Clostridium sp.]|uniref:FliH/SctL family protein n=1 Tax=uncultured Clostridium sp. TaxID=59620 RepID=UPI0025FA87C7|nr:FliH/SctL family protein [uncultured Clostridium sp.]
MQSSYNLVKKGQVLEGDSKVINTEYIPPKHISKKTEITCDPEIYIGSYENIAKNILEDARQKSENIRSEAIAEARNIEKDAYEQGYLQGKNNGYEDGKKEAIESVLPQATNEANRIKSEASELLLRATEDYNNYLEEKKLDIIKLSITIAEKILRREVSVDTGINDMIEDAFKQVKGEESVVIKCNEMYIDEIKSKIDYWKQTYSISKDIFVFKDNLDYGSVIIEKSTGKIEMSIENGLDSIVKSILG